MTGEMVQHLASLFQQGTMTELEYVDEEFRIALRRPVARLKPVDESGACPEHSAENGAAKTFHIKAPAAGVFYGTHPFVGDARVSVGTNISDGDVVGYLDIEGLLSCVRTTVAGRVDKIHVCDGQLAGFDTVLLSVSG